MTSLPTFPAGPIAHVRGRALVLEGDDIDTDRIIPARFLKCVSFEALGDQVFADDRNELDGSHAFDRSVNQGASILVVNGNFGCGSSREHAPQALMRWGIRAVIGQSFAEIFYGNCLALGIPCALASVELIKQIQALILADHSLIWTLDVENESLTSSSEQSWDLTIDSGPREMMLSGRWDATSQLISQSDALNLAISRIPYLNNFLPKSC